MKKSIVCCGLILLLFSNLLQAAPEKNSTRQRPLHSFKAQRISKSTLLSTLNDYIVWQDDFEKTGKNWWPDANYVMQNDTTTLPGHSNWQFAA
ncbi:hypothetical protein KAH55_14570, partial [bacterium]|nr:hypothetical protein [bacterium]